METCQNCGRAIGKLETPHLHAEAVVCAECKQRLSPPIVYASPSTTTSPIDNPVVIEQTGKRWKLQMLLGGMICVLGVILFVVGAAMAGPSSPSPGSFSFGDAGLMALVVGLTWYAVARVCAWWFHG